MPDYAHQEANAARIVSRLRAGHNAGDWSETGTGKTFTALRTMREFPTPSLVVGPKISRTAWLRAGVLTGTEFDYVGWEALRYGNTPYGWWERRRRAGIEWVRCPQLTEHGLEGVWFYRFRFHPGVRRVYWDEFHRARSHDSRNACMVRGAFDQRLQLVGLSATPAADPTEMRALGTMLGWFEWSDWYKWALRNGCWKPIFGGLKFVESGPNAERYLAPLRAAMVEAGPKTTLRSIQPEHGLVVAPRLVDVDEGTLKEVAALWARAFELEEQIRAKIATAPNAAAEYGAVRQRLELLRVKSTAELIADKLADGCTVLVFCQYRATLDAYADLYPQAGRIHGDVGQAERQRVMDEVDAGRLRLVLLQNAAGSESINFQDRSGVRPVVQVVSVPDSAYQLIQIAGRADRLGSKSTPVMVPIFVAGTVEEKRWAKVSAKADRINTLTDDDLRAR